MDKTPASSSPQDAEKKPGVSKVVSFLEPAAQNPAPDTKKKRERSPLRIPATSRMSLRLHVTNPKQGQGYSCRGLGDEPKFPPIIRLRTKWKTAEESPKTTGETSTDYNKSPTCTKPKREDGSDYYESLENTIAASIKSVESSPPSKTFWESPEALPEYFTKDSTKTPPKVLPPFRKTTPTKPKVRTELFPEIHETTKESKVPESPSTSTETEPQPPKNEPSTSAEIRSPSYKLPKSRSDFRDNSEWVKFNCLDFQDYKRTVNNRQKGVEQSINQALPAMNSAMKDAQRLATKITKIRSEVCDKEETLRIQNDKLKYLVGRTMSTVVKVNDVLERFRGDILAYTTLTTEGNEGIDMRLSRLLKALCGLDDRRLNVDKAKLSLIKEAFSEERTEKTPKDSNT